MADILDVSNAIAQAIANALYPQGPSSAPITGLDTYIYSGWPNATDLDAHLAANGVDVSIFAQPNTEQVTTRVFPEWVDQIVTTPSITATVSGYTVTIGGTMLVGEYVSVNVGGQPYSYMVQDGDTPTTVAAALAALASVVSVGPVITFSTLANGRIVARCGAPGTLMREVRRQKRGFMITIWAPSPTARSAVAGIIDSVLGFTNFLALPDGTQAWLSYRGSDDLDQMQKAMCYRRDIKFAVEYPTIQTMAGYPITIMQTTEQGSNFVGTLGPSKVITQ